MYHLIDITDRCDNIHLIEPHPRRIRKAQPNSKIKCKICSKKITLAFFKCKCKLYLCATHRYPDKHNCTL